MRAGCRCENMVFVCLFVCWSRSESVTFLLTVRSRGAQFEQALRYRLLPDFDAVFSDFFTDDSPFRRTTQFSYSSLGGDAIFTKLRSKIAKSLKIGGKVCAHHFVQIAEVFEKKFHSSSLGGYMQMCTYIKKICARRHLALTASVNFVQVVQKRLGMNKFVRTKSPTGSKFSQFFLSNCVYRMDSSCAPMFQFFSVASDGATTERQIQNRVFWSISCQFEEGQHRQLCIDLDAVFAICYTTRCTLQCTKRFAVPSVGGATRVVNLWWKFSETYKFGRIVVRNTSYTYYLHYNYLHSRIAAYAHDNILQVCIVLDGTMLLFLVFLCSTPQR